MGDSTEPSPMNLLESRHGSSHFGRQDSTCYLSHSLSRPQLFSQINHTLEPLALYTQQNPLSRIMKQPPELADPQLRPFEPLVSSQVLASGKRRREIVVRLRCASFHSYRHCSRNSNDRLCKQRMHKLCRKTFYSANCVVHDKACSESRSNRINH